MEGADQRRLERYDLFADKVRTELSLTEAQLAELKAERKTRTATYQQLFANRMTLQQIVDRLKEAGL
jgi:DNA-binding MarR family transcriptional regulator